MNFIDVYVNSVNMPLPFVNSGARGVNVKEGSSMGGTILGIEEAKVLTPRMSEISSDDLNVDETVTAEQKTSLLHVLNRYRMCIALNVEEIGKTSLMEMNIETTNDDPVFRKPYRLSARDRDDLDNLITDYKKAGIIEETESPYASPAFVVRKTDGSPHLVVDYRGLNAVTRAIHYPILNFDDMLEQLNGAKFFTTLDLACGYLQLPLAEEAQPKTAIITETQTGQFTRAMLGLANAPFAKLMDKALGMVRKSGIAFLFFDDICGHEANWEEMLKNLQIILECLKKASLTLNIKKCHFGMRVAYLGYVLGEGCI